jgi:hypothetical protein
MFGALQILTGLRYRMPMPVQPLKAMAALVIAQQISGNVLAGGALAIGVLMLCLSLTGLLDWVARIVPKPVVRCWPARPSPGSPNSSVCLHPSGAPGRPFRFDGARVVG